MGTRTRLEYHLGFSTRHHKPSLLGLESDVFQAMDNAARGQQFEILEAAIDKSTHIHLIVCLRPTISIQQVVDRLKRLSNLELWSNHEAQLKKSYWTGKRALWDKEYFAESISKASRDVILNYIRQQKK